LNEVSYFPVGRDNFRQFSEALTFLVLFVLRQKEHLKEHVQASIFQHCKIKVWMAPRFAVPAFAGMTNPLAVYYFTDNFYTMQFLIIKRPRENFIETMTEEESQIMSAHFLYLKQKLAEGKLIMAGPVTTGDFGISVVETDSEDQAREIVNNDPAVVAGIMKPTLYPYRVSLLRGRDD
jgi:uncharacterized protein YciI